MRLARASPETRAQRKAFSLKPSSQAVANRSSEYRYTPGACCSVDVNSHMSTDMPGPCIAYHLQSSSCTALALSEFELLVTAVYVPAPCIVPCACMHTRRFACTYATLHAHTLQVHLEREPEVCVPGMAVHQGQVNAGIYVKNHEGACCYVQGD